MGTQLSPEYWHARAEETRTLADEMKHAETKAALIHIADGYERIAKIAEDMQQKQRELARPNGLNPN